MHVCFVTESYVAEGSLAGKSLHDRARALVAHGLDVSVVTLLRAGQMPHEVLDGVRIIRLPYVESRLYVPRLVLSGIRALATLHRRHPLDVIHGHWAATAGFVSTVAGQVLGVASVVSVKGFDVQYSDEFPDYGAYRSRFVRRMVGYTLNHATRIKCISERLRLLVESDWGITRSDIAVIYPALGEDFLGEPLAPRTRDSGAELRVLAVGALRSIKRIEDAVAAIGQLGDRGVSASLIAAGPDYGSLDAVREMSRSRGVADAVTLVGNAARQEVVALYDSCDVLVAPSVLEGFGMAPLEAMARGRPAIVTTMAGVAEVIEDGVTGFIVPPRRPDLIADRLSALAAQPELARRLGDEAALRVREKFVYSRWVREILALYEAALDENRGNSRRFQESPATATRAELPWYGRR